MKNRTLILAALACVLLAGLPNSVVKYGTMACITSGATGVVA